MKQNIPMIFKTRSASDHIPVKFGGNLPTSIRGAALIFNTEKLNISKAKTEKALPKISEEEHPECMHNMITPAKFDGNRPTSIRVLLINLKNKKIRTSRALTPAKKLAKRQ